ncbi:MAG: hypothetical protein AAGC74_00580 [Verrucomicrobiota bacterium]
MRYTKISSRLQSLSGKCCPLCGSTDIAWSWLTWCKIVAIFCTGLLAFAITVWLPVLRRCRTCNLTFKAPMARLFR